MEKSGLVTSQIQEIFTNKRHSNYKTIQYNEISRQKWFPLLFLAILIFVLTNISNFCIDSYVYHVYWSAECYNVTTWTQDSQARKIILCRLRAGTFHFLSQLSAFIVCCNTAALPILLLIYCSSMQHIARQDHYCNAVVCAETEKRPLQLTATQMQ